MRRLTWARWAIDSAHGHATPPTLAQVHNAVNTIAALAPSSRPAGVSNTAASSARGTTRPDGQVTGANAARVLLGGAGGE